MPVPKRSVVCIAVAAIGALNVPCAVGAAGDDLVTVRTAEVKLEEELIRKIPDVPRHCDSFDGVKRRVTIGDCELYCELEGEGIPLVLVHGGPGATHHYFHPTFSRARSFARVIYYDQRGCGVSDYNKGQGYSIDQAVDDLENLRKALKVSRWVVLGHSYGGLLAQCYSVKYPDPIAGLVLVGSDDAMALTLQPTRQYEFLTQQERDRIRETHANAELTITQRLYNAFLNGDWKRQHYYKPSRDDIARVALYEWKHETGFNGVMSAQMQRVDLQGAFEGCPIPTLIVEGKWDLTWNTDKPEKLLQNHPGAKLVICEAAGHSPFADEPEKFFGLLKEFVEGLREIPSGRLAPWKEHLATWTAKRGASFANLVRSAGWGRKSNERVASAFSSDGLAELKDPTLLLKTGFALYDAKRYEEALAVFGRLSDNAGEDTFLTAVGLVWQGHMLDLLGKRAEAVAIYKRIVDMRVDGAMRHDQYGLAYSPSVYAAERVKTPFVRVENRDSD